MENHGAFGETHVPVEDRTCGRCGVTYPTLDEAAACEDVHLTQGKTQVVRHDGSRAMRFAYADPPYLGCCKLYDHFHGGDGRCWDEAETHSLLIARLCDEYPDGWALSATSNSLRTILPLCPEDVRVGSWVKPFCAFKKGTRPCYAWEPLIFRGGRNPSSGHRHAPPAKGGKQNTPKDFIAESITLKRGFTGAKPAAVMHWICDLLNVQPGDEVADLFAGSGASSEAIAGYLGATPTVPGSLFSEVLGAVG